MSADIRRNWRNDDMKDILQNVLAPRYTLPRGYTTIAFRSVRPDLTSSHGYRWPFPGNVAKAAAPDRANTGACPIRVGDGICVALTYSAMASSCIPATHLLVTAHRPSDVLGVDAGKIRVRSCRVLDIVDGSELLRVRGANANLRGAELCGANLRGANLYGADLYGANLCGANLSGANLRGANLYGAELGGADLCNASLWGADLSKANLYGADLSNASLYDATGYMP